METTCQGNAFILFVRPQRCTQWAACMKVSLLYSYISSCTEQQEENDESGVTDSQVCSYLTMVMNCDMYKRTGAMIERFLSVGGLCVLANSRTFKYNMTVNVVHSAAEGGEFLCAHL